ncbi:flagellar protein FlaG [Liquorilactobacillus uvarum]|uniref:flagellar protein FlaG n=1 Tax=Liquorilactobacillus uvarum TaxID=303240 RepID=UPI00288BDAE4|nr:flagellar protein FlaG [Liquorilactobacillus uvarum]
MEIEKIQPVPPTTRVQPIETDNDLDGTNLDLRSLAQDLLADSDGKSEKDETTVEPSSDSKSDEVFQAISHEDLNNAVNEMNKQLLGRDVRLKFKVHETTGRTYVQLINMKNDDVIKEIPPAKMLDVIGSIWQQMGIVVDKKG